MSENLEDTSETLEETLNEIKYVGTEEMTEEEINLQCELKLVEETLQITDVHVIDNESYDAEGNSLGISTASSYQPAAEYPFLEHHLLDKSLNNTDNQMNFPSSQSLQAELALLDYNPQHLPVKEEIETSNEVPFVNKSIDLLTVENKDKQKLDENEFNCRIKNTTVDKDNQNSFEIIPILKYQSNPISHISDKDCGGTVINDEIFNSNEDEFGDTISSDGGLNHYENCIKVQNLHTLSTNDPLETSDVGKHKPNDFGIRLDDCGKVHDSANIPLASQEHLENEKTVLMKQMNEIIEEIFENAVNSSVIIESNISKTPFTTSNSYQCASIEDVKEEINQDYYVISANNDKNNTPKEEDACLTLNLFLSESCIPQKDNSEQCSSVINEAIKFQGDHSMQETDFHITPSSILSEEVKSAKNHMEFTQEKSPIIDLVLSDSYDKTFNSLNIKQPHNDLETDVVQDELPDANTAKGTNFGAHVPFKTSFESEPFTHGLGEFFPQEDNHEHCSLVINETIKFQSDQSMQKTDFHVEPSTVLPEEVKSAENNFELVQEKSQKIDSVLCDSYDNTIKSLCIEEKRYNDFQTDVVQDQPPDTSTAEEAHFEVQVPFKTSVESELFTLGECFPQKDNHEHCSLVINETIKCQSDQSMQETDFHVGPSTKEKQSAENNMEFIQEKSKLNDSVLDDTYENTINSEPYTLGIGECIPQKVNHEHCSLVINETIKCQSDQSMQETDCHMEPSTVLPEVLMNCALQNSNSSSIILTKLNTSNNWEPKEDRRISTDYFLQDNQSLITNSNAQDFIGGVSIKESLCDKPISEKENTLLLLEKLQSNLSPSQHKKCLEDSLHYPDFQVKFVSLDNTCTEKENFGETVQVINILHDDHDEDLTTSSHYLQNNQVLTTKSSAEGFQAEGSSNECVGDRFDKATKENGGEDCNIIYSFNVQISSNVCNETSCSDSLTDNISKVPIEETSCALGNHECLENQGSLDGKLLDNKSYEENSNEIFEDINCLSNTQMNISRSIPLEIDIVNSSLAEEVSNTNPCLCEPQDIETEENFNPLEGTKHDEQSDEVLHENSLPLEDSLKYSCCKVDDPNKPITEGICVSLDKSSESCILQEQQCLKDASFFLDFQSSPLVLLDTESEKKNEMNSAETSQEMDCISDNVDSSNVFFIKEDTSGTFTVAKACRTPDASFDYCVPQVEHYNKHSSLSQDFKAGNIICGIGDTDSNAENNLLILENVQSNPCSSHDEEYLKDSIFSQDFQAKLLSPENNCPYKEKIVEVIDCDLNDHWDFTNESFMNLNTSNIISEEMYRSVNSGPCVQNNDVPVNHLEFSNNSSLNSTDKEAFITSISEQAKLSSSQSYDKNCIGHNKSLVNEEICNGDRNSEETIEKKTVEDHNNTCYISKLNEAIDQQQNTLHDMSITLVDAKAEMSVSLDCSDVMNKSHILGDDVTLTKESEATDNKYLQAHNEEETISECHLLSQNVNDIVKNINIKETNDFNSYSDQKMSDAIYLPLSDLNEVNNQSITDHGLQSFMELTMANTNPAIFEQSMALLTNNYKYKPSNIHCNFDDNYEDNNYSGENQASQNMTLLKVEEENIECDIPNADANPHNNFDHSMQTKSYETMQQSMSDYVSTQSLKLTIPDCDKLSGSADDVLRQQCEEQTENLLLMKWPAHFYDQLNALKEQNHFLSKQIESNRNIDLNIHHVKEENKKLVGKLKEVNEQFQLMKEENHLLAEKLKDVDEEREQLTVIKKENIQLILDLESLKDMNNDFENLKIVNEELIRNIDYISQEKNCKSKALNDKIENLEQELKEMTNTVNDLRSHNENLSALVTVVNEKDNKIKDLLEEKLNLEETIMSLNKSLEKLNELKTENHQLKNEVEREKNESKKVQQENHSLEEQIFDLNSQNELLWNELKVSTTKEQSLYIIKEEKLLLEDKLARLKKEVQEIDNLKVENERMNKDIDSINSEIYNLMDDKKKLKSSLMKANNKLNYLESENEDLHIKIDQLNVELCTSNENVNAFVEEKRMLQNQIDDLMKRDEELDSLVKTERTALLDNVSSLSECINSMLTENEAFYEQIQKYETQIQILNDFEKENDLMKKQLANKQASFDELQLQNTCLLNEVNYLEESVKLLTEDLDIRKSQCDKIIDLKEKNKELGLRVQSLMETVNEFEEDKEVLLKNLSGLTETLSSLLVDQQLLTEQSMVVSEKNQHISSLTYEKNQLTQELINTRKQISELENLNTSLSNNLENVKVKELALNELKDLTKEMDIHITSLNEELMSEVMKNDLLSAKICTNEDLEQQLNSIKDEKLYLKNCISLLEKNIQDFQHKNDVLKVEHMEYVKENEEIVLAFKNEQVSLKTCLQTNVEQINNLNLENVTLKEELEAVQQEANQLSENFQNIHKQLISFKDLELKFNNVNEELIGLKEENKELGLQVKLLMETISTLKEDKEFLLKDLSGLSETLSSLLVDQQLLTEQSRVVEEKHQHISLLTYEKNQLTQELINIKKQVSELENLNTSLSNNLKVKDVALNELKDLTKEMDIHISSLNEGLMSEVMKNDLLLAKICTNEDLEQQLNSINDERLYLKNCISLLEENIQDFQHKNDVLKVEHMEYIKENEEIVLAFKNEQASLKTCLQTNVDKINNLNLENVTLKEELEAVQQEANQLSENYQNIQKQLKSLKDLELEFNKINEEKCILELENHTLITKLQNFEEDVFNLKNKLTNEIAKYDSLSVVNTNLEIQITNMSSSIKELGSENESMKNDVKDNIELRQIMLKEIHSLIGELDTNFESYSGTYVFQKLMTEFLNKEKEVMLALQCECDTKIMTAQSEIKQNLKQCEDEKIALNNELHGIKHEIIPQLEGEISLLTNEIRLKNVENFDSQSQLEKLRLTENDLVKVVEMEQQLQNQQQKTIDDLSSKLKQAEDLISEINLQLNNKSYENDKINKFLECKMRENEEHLKKIEELSLSTMRLHNLQSEIELIQQWVGTITEESIIGGTILESVEKFNSLGIIVKLITMKWKNHLSEILSVNTDLKTDLSKEREHCKNLETQLNCLNEELKAFKILYDEDVLQLKEDISAKNCIITELSDINLKLKHDNSIVQTKMDIAKQESEELKQLQEELTKQKEENVKLKELCKKLNIFKEVNRKLSLEIEDLSMSIKVEKQNNNDLKSKYNMSTNQLAELKKKNYTLEDTIEILESKLQNHGVISSINVEFPLGINSIDKQVTFINERLTELEMVKTELEAVIGENVSLKTEYEKSKEHIKRQEEKLSKILRRELDLKKQMALSTQNISNESKILTELKTELFSLLPDQASSLNDALSKLKEIMEENKTFKNNRPDIIEELRKKVEEATQENKDLDYECEMMHKHIKEQEELVSTVLKREEELKKTNEDLKFQLSIKEQKHNGSASEEYLGEVFKIFSEKPSSLKEALELTKNLFAENQLLKDKVTEAQEEYAGLDKECEDMYSAYQEKEKELTDVLKREDKTKSDMKDLEEKVVCLTGELESVRAELLAKSKHSNSVSECQCDELKSRLEKLKLDIADRNAKVTALELQVEADNFPIKKKAADLEKSLDQAKHKINELKSEVRRYQEQMHEVTVGLRVECERCRHSTSLRQDIGMQTLSESQEQQLNDQLAQKNKEIVILKGLCKTRNQKIAELEKMLGTTTRTLRSSRSALKEVKENSNLSPPQTKQKKGAL